MGTGGLRIKQLAARFGGLIPPGPDATDELLRKIYAEVDALVAERDEAVDLLITVMDEEHIDAERALGVVINEFLARRIPTGDPVLPNEGDK